MDPYRNLAMEKGLTERAAEGLCTLYLWQNRKTVVIGRNQNAWAECRVQALREDGGQLARRLSGGGAVYHDEGNLNFSFLTRKEDSDIGRQSEVVLRAVRKLGVPAEKSGRNDFTAEGRKFSGNAFYEHQGCCCHHGTLMMNVDAERMTRYLTADPGKLRSRGVDSVRSRVVNLKEYCPLISAEMLAEKMTEAFSEVYGLEVDVTEENLPTEESIRQDAAWLASEEWLFPARIPFSQRMERRYDWGGVCLEIQVQGGNVRQAVCWSDAMDAEGIRRIGGALAGLPYDREVLAGSVLARGNTKIGQDIAEMIREEVKA